MRQSPRIIVLATDAALTTVLLEDAKQYPDNIQIVKALPETTGLFDILVLPANFFLSAKLSTIRNVIFVYGSAQMLSLCYIQDCYDFIKEPWNLGEVVFKTRKLISTIQVHPVLPIYIEDGMLVSGTNKISLTNREEIIFRCLARNYGKIVTRVHLALFLQTNQQIGIDNEPSRSIDIHITRLRKKLLLLSNQDIFPVIKTVYAQGYTLTIVNCG